MVFWLGFILIDIIQHVFNLYINYQNDAPILENIIGNNFKFNKNLHFYIDESISVSGKVLCMFNFDTNKMTYNFTSIDGAKITFHITDTEKI